MPEGPEIRHHRNRLLPMKGKQLTEINILSGRYMRAGIEKIGAPPGQIVNDVEVKGKLLGFWMDEHCILATAGMSGWWAQGEPDSKFKRIELVFGKEKFTFVDQRNFGTFKVATHDEANEKFESLGVDVFRNDSTTVQDLKSRLAKHAKVFPICEVLLDQRIFAGVGNYIRAEAMYKAKIHPKTPARNITDQQLADLWRAIHTTALEAYELEHNYHDLCYRRETTNKGEKVVNFMDRNKRTVWYVDQTS